MILEGTHVRRFRQLTGDADVPEIGEDDAETKSYEKEQRRARLATASSA
jgi:hypothetical protein